ncbi:MAG: bifunctional methylenetetrahydrofolate dehydrogenase/methenyltetrahydrofolate cyclohydrolase FolD [Alphaproteobacteria bacterium]|nr:bifunctional methylenetetrahydrofolate dehydrogenase/methenyltetrahydrofolate cyclohydrolase FolD [Alphaproteobacteria bacterium]
MSAKLIDGKQTARESNARVAAAVAELKASHGIVPGLTVVLVGEDPASKVYVASKEREAKAAGMNSTAHRLPATATQDEVLALVRRLNADPSVHGILVQLPLPKQVDAQAVIEALDPDKDVDGFHTINTGRLWGQGGGLVPCTPQGSMLLLRQAVAQPAGAHAVVVGRSMIVGKPVAALLLAADCTVTVAHSKSRDLPGICRGADILIAAVGRPEMVRGGWVKPGAVVIDVGINRTAEGKLVGDVAFAEAAEVAGAITPVPGGVGPMTIACLLRNTVIAACRRHGKPVPAL